MKALSDSLCNFTANAESFQDRGYGSYIQHAHERPLHQITSGGSQISELLHCTFSNTCIMSADAKAGEKIAHGH